MKEKFEKFWSDKADPLHRFDSAEHLEDYGDELRLLFRRENIKSVLDIGCGTGALYKSLQFDKVKKYKGVDFSASMLKVFSKNFPKANLECADGSSFNDGEKYDLIFSNAVIQNFNKEMFLSHLKNANEMLAEGGTLVIASNPWSSLRLSYLAGEAGANPIAANIFKGAARLITHGGRSFGRWMSMKQLATIARSYGFEVVCYGSVHYPYRFHAKMKRNDDLL